jgi:cell division protein FtsA
LKKNILGIDIGSSKTVAIIANIENEPTITGVGIAKSKGIKKGTITNIDYAANSIKQAVNDAKRIAGINGVNDAIVSISTAYTQSIHSTGIISVPEKEITRKEINRVIQTAIYNAKMPKDDYVLLQAIPYDFKVDDINDIEDPEGMSGDRLEVSVHIIVAQKTAIENIKRMLQLAGINIQNIVLSSFASAIATLNEDEKEQGVVLIDIGATTSDLIVFKENAIRWTEFVGVGSHHITNDLAMALHTTISKAEDIKLEISKYKDDDIIEIPLIGDENDTKPTDIISIKEVMNARINETLLILNQLVEKSGFKDEIIGIVLTGGFTNLDGLRERAIELFGNNAVRIAKPKEMNGLFETLKAPEFSTAIGLILYSLGKHSSYEIDSNNVFRSKYSIEDTTKEIEDNSPEMVVIEDNNNEKNTQSSPIQKAIMWFKNLF